MIFKVNVSNFSMDLCGTAFKEVVIIKLKNSLS